MRDGSGEDPVLVNKSAAFVSSAQTRAHLLCGEFEHRFNDGGEDWARRLRLSRTEEDDRSRDQDNPHTGD